MPQPKSKSAAAAPGVPKPFAKFWRDPDLPGLEIRFSSYRESAFPKHTHDSYSLGLVLRGGCRAFLAGRDMELEPGELCVMHPGEVHACNPLPGSGWTYRMFHIDAPLMAQAASALGACPPDGPGFARPVFGDPFLAAQLTALHHAVARGGEALEKESLLESALGRLIIRHGSSAPAPEPAEEPGAVRIIRDYLDARATDKVRLEELAAATGLSRYAVLRAFRRATGLTPHEYQTQLRIARARRLLQAGASLPDVALDTGYADQSHFTHAFRQVTGTTPRQYQRGV